MGELRSREIGVGAVGLGMQVFLVIAVLLVVDVEARRRRCRRMTRAGRGGLERERAEWSKGRRTKRSEGGRVRREVKSRRHEALIDERRAEVAGRRGILRRLDRVGRRGEARGRVVGWPGSLGCANESQRVVNNDQPSEKSRD